MLDGWDTLQRESLETSTEPVSPAPVSMLGEEWVVRGGEAKEADLIKGYGPHALVPGLYGFSVQYAPGKTVAELAQAARFPNATVSYETAAMLAHVVASVGYELRLIPSPGRGYHHTFCVLYDATGTMQMRLPNVVAHALTMAFRRMPNPHPTPYSGPKGPKDPGKLGKPGRR